MEICFPAFRFPFQALAFGGNIDLDLQHQARSPTTATGRHGIGRHVVDDLHSESLPELGMGANSAISSPPPATSSGMRWAGRRPSRHAGCGRRRPGLEALDLGFAASSMRVGRPRVAGKHDRLLRLAAGDRGHRLPQLFGDERDQRVGQAQDRFQRADQRAAGAALLGFVAGLDLDLGDFQIPVAELVPDELVDGLGNEVETVVGEVLLDFLFDRCSG
jgi:hypothetical protein